MAATDRPADDEDDVTGMRYEGFSDYRNVSRRIVASVDEAVDAYAAIEGAHSQEARVSSAEAARAASSILGAATKLLPELREGRDVGDGYAELIDNWTGEDGHIERLKRSSLRDECPEWLGEFVREIRTAAWRLGYLQAGQTVEEGDTDPVKQGAESVFEGL